MRNSNKTFQEWTKISLPEMVSDFLKDESLVDLKKDPKLQECLDLTLKAHRLLKESSEAANNVARKSRKNVKFQFQIIKQKAIQYKPSIALRQESLKATEEAMEIDRGFSTFYTSLLNLNDLKSEITNLNLTPTALKKKLEYYADDLRDTLAKEVQLLGTNRKSLKQKIVAMLKTEIDMADSSSKNANEMHLILMDKDHKAVGKTVAGSLNAFIESWEKNSKHGTEEDANHIPAMQCYNNVARKYPKLVRDYKNANRDALPQYEKLNVSNNLYKTTVHLVRRLINKLLLPKEQPTSTKNRKSNVRPKYILKPEEINFIRNNEDVLARLLFKVSGPYGKIDYSPVELQTIQKRLVRAYNPNKGLSLFSNCHYLGPTLKEGFKKNTSEKPQMNIQDASLN